MFSEHLEKENMVFCAVFFELIKQLRFLLDHVDGTVSQETVYNSYKVSRTSH